MKKRVIAVLLCAVMLIGLLPQFTVNAEATAIQISDTNIYWEITGNTLTISGTGVMPNYTHYSQQPWHTARSKITSVVIQDGVTEVGVSAFNHLTNLTDVTIPSSVTCIKGEGFMDCPKLSSVVIPSSVKNISYDAFKNCTSLASIILPSTVEFSNTPFDMTGDEKSITLSVGLSGTEWTNNKFTNNIEYGFTTKVPYALYLLPDAVADEQLTGVTPVKNNSNGGIHICGDTYSTTNWKTITANAPSNGTYTVNGESITTAKTLYVGEDTPITLTATPATGYAFGGWTVKDESNQNVAVTNNSFTMPESNVTVTPTFKKLSKVSWTDPANGTISATFGTGNTTITSGATDVTEGETVTVTATPSAGYQLSAVTVNGSSDGVTINGNTATFTMPASDTTVSATMSPIDYTITANAAANGKYSVSKDSTAIYTDVTANQNSYTAAHIGETYTLTATPDTGYSLTSWGVTGAASTNGNSFTVGASNVTIAPTFAMTDHAVTYTAPTNGSYTLSVNSGTAVSANTTAQYGQTVAIAITPGTHYEVDTVSVVTTAGNTPVEVSGTGNSRSFIMPDAPVTVTVTFKAIKYTVTATKTDASGWTYGVGGVVADYLNSRTVDIAYNETVTIKVTGKGGSTAESFTVTKNGTNETVEVTKDGDNYTFTMPGCPVTITSSFTRKSFTLTIGECVVNGKTIGTFTVKRAGGTVLKTGDTVYYGEPLYFEGTTSNEYYKYVGWKMDTTGGNSNYIMAIPNNPDQVSSFTIEPRFSAQIVREYISDDDEINTEYHPLTGCFIKVTNVGNDTNFSSLEKNTRARLRAYPNFGCQWIEWKVYNYDDPTNPVEIEIKQDNDGNSDYDYFIMPDAPVVVKAKFNLIRYNVSLQSRIDGTETSVAHLAGGGERKHYSKETLNAPSIDGFTFVGWYVDNGANYKGDLISENQRFTYVLYDYKSPKDSSVNYDFETPRNMTLTAVYAPMSSVVEVKIDAPSFSITGAGVDGIAQHGLQTYRVKTGTELNLYFNNTNSEYTFQCWANGNNKIVGTQQNYKFTVTATTSLHAVYGSSDIQKISEGVYESLVIFRSTYGQVLQARSYLSTDTIKFPQSPILLGNTFTRWVINDGNLDDDAVEATESAIKALMSTQSIINIIPEFVEKDETFKVTVVAMKYNEEGALVTATPEQGYSSPTGGEGKVGNGVLTHTPSQIGQNLQFMYWTDITGKILSYDTRYTVYGTKKDETITIWAVYGPKVPDAKTVITVTASQGANGQKIRVTFSETFYINNTNGDVKNVSSGFLITTGNQPNELSMRIDSPGILVYTSSLPSDGLSGTYMLHLNTTQAGLTIYARGYVQYFNSENVLITEYSDIMEYTTMALSA